MIDPYEKILVINFLLTVSKRWHCKKNKGCDNFLQYVLQAFEVK